jgi:cell wall-associated NlpC family hydrolase
MRSWTTRTRAAAEIAAIGVLLTPAVAQAQAEFNIGPFLGYSSIRGGHPAMAGLQTGVLIGPVGLRASGFSALDQPGTSTVATNGAARWGGDADLMFIFDLASRGSGGSQSLAPYVFAGAGMAVLNESQLVNGSYADVTGNWSYGAGLLIPIGSSLEAMSEFRQRPAGFFNLAPSTRESTHEWRIGLSIRLGSSSSSSRNYAERPHLISVPSRSRVVSEERRIEQPGITVIPTTDDDAETSGGMLSAARVIPTAERYIGTRYRYGGTSPSTGFDCSGFVQYVFARHDVRLPRNSRQQATVGMRLRPNARYLLPGDLVMFAEDGERISHVAIYAGHNKIIHSSSSGSGVRYDNLSTKRGQWFADHMVAARRVVPDARGILLDLAKLLDPKLRADSLFDPPDHAPRW